VKRVLLISVDGLHSLDLVRWVKKHQDDSTAIVVSAKHGNSPIDSKRRHLVDEDLIATLVNQVGKNLAAHVTVDTVALIWLKDQAKTPDVVAKLRTNARPAGILKVYWGDSLALKFPDPSADSRAPDIIVQPELGVMYVEPKSSKLAEHGGQFDEDTNVALLVSAPGATGARITAGVQTTQVAPTILKLLGLDPLALIGVKAEGTPVLPGF
jgi:arylsulfatase A-like enzyme